MGLEEERISEISSAQRRNLTVDEMVEDNLDAAFSRQFNESLKKIPLTTVFRDTLMRMALGDSFEEHKGSQRYRRDKSTFSSNN